jgi:hypothetical protein
MLLILRHYFLGHAQWSIVTMFFFGGGGFDFTTVKAPTDCKVPFLAAQNPW